MSAAAARRRHPSTQTPVPGRCVASRVTELLQDRGVRWPRVAAAVLEVRGRTGLSPGELASRLIIDPDVLRGAEAGEVALAQLPEPLRAWVLAVLPMRAVDDVD